jgi:hypothetical protein
MGVGRHQRRRHHVRGAGAPRHQRRIARPRQRRRDRTPQADQRSPVGRHPGGRRRHDPGHGEVDSPRCGRLQRLLAPGHQVSLPGPDASPDGRRGLRHRLGDLAPRLPRFPPGRTHRDPQRQVPRQIGPKPGGKNRLDRVTRSTAQTNHRHPRGLALPLHVARSPPMADTALATARTRAARRFAGGPPGIIGLLPSRRGWYADHARATQAACPPRQCAACACFHPFAVLGIGISPASAAFLLRPGPVFVKSRFEGASVGPEGELCSNP